MVSSSDLFMVLNKKILNNMINSAITISAFFFLSIKKRNPDKIFSKNKIGKIRSAKISLGKNSDPNKTQTILIKNNSNRYLKSFSITTINLPLMHYQKYNRDNQPCIIHCKMME